MTSRPYVKWIISLTWWRKMAPYIPPQVINLCNKERSSHHYYVMQLLRTPLDQLIDLYTGLRNFEHSTKLSWTHLKYFSLVRGNPVTLIISSSNAYISRYLSFIVFPLKLWENTMATLSLFPWNLWRKFTHPFSLNLGLHSTYSGLAQNWAIWVCGCRPPCQQWK